MKFCELQKKSDELESKAIEMYQKGEYNLAIFFKNASIHLLNKAMEMVNEEA